MNVSLLQLWLPVLLGGLLAWIASALVHIVLKYHNSDYRPLANEDEVAAAMRSGNVARGFYSLPYCKDMSAMGEEAMQQKFREGPVALVAVMPNGMPKMGLLMVQQIVFFVLGCGLIAYCASLALNPGADYLTVFRFVAAVGFFGFGWAVIPFAIWYGHPWPNTAKYLLDALIYALVVAGVFAALWPAA